MNLTMPAQPDTATTTDTTVGWADTAWAHLTNWAGTTGPLYTLTGILALALLLSIRSRRKRAKAEAAGTKAELTRADRAITRITGILATAVVATGAWKVFGDVLHLHWTFKVVLFFFAEAQIVAAWRRVRRHIYRHHDLGPGIRTIYLIAFGSALVAAFDADNLVEVLLRLFAALVAAYMIAEELAEELDIHLTTNPHLAVGPPKRRGRIRWAHNLESVMVWLRLAQATDRTLEDVERQRRIARFARTAYRLQVLKEDDAAKLRIQLVRWSLRRQTEAANEHLNLAGDPNALGSVRAQLALLYGVEAGTSRTAVADLDPLGGNTVKALTAESHLSGLSGQEIGNLMDNLTGQPPALTADTRPDTMAVTGPDTVADIAGDTTPDTDPTGAPDADRTSVPDTTQDAPVDIGEDTSPDSLEDTVTDTQPDTQTPRPPAQRRVPRRTPHRTPKWTKEQLKAFRLRDNQPDITYPMIAREVGVSEKTVSRWFKARADAESPSVPDIRPDIPPTFELPKPPAFAGTNGNRPTLTEESK